jgi:hypothetical protein
VAKVVECHPEFKPQSPTKRKEKKKKITYQGHGMSQNGLFCFALVFWCWGWNSGPTPGATPPALFCEGLFLK